VLLLDGLYTSSFDLSILGMRITRVVIVISVCGRIASVAGAQDTTTALGSARMVGAPFLSGFTLGFGLGMTPDVAGGMGVTADGHFSLSFSALPGWTFGVSKALRASPKTTAYVAASGARPTLESTAAGLQVQRRWARPNRVIQPIASVTVGTFDNYYYKDIIFQRYVYEEKWVPYADLAGGAEFSVRRWMRVATTTGLRLTSATMPKAPGSGFGIIGKALLEFGVF